MAHASELAGDADAHAADSEFACCFEIENSVDNCLLTNHHILRGAASLAVLLLELGGAGAGAILSSMVRGNERTQSAKAIREYETIAAAMARLEAQLNSTGVNKTNFEAAKLCRSMRGQIDSFIIIYI